MQRAKLVASAREDALIATCGQIPVHVRRVMAVADEPIHLTITFHPPDRRRRDLDNMLASAKALLDGFANACQVDDHRFELTLRRGEPVKLGEVLVSLWITGLSRPIAFLGGDAPVTGLLPVEKGATE